MVSTMLDNSMKTIDSIALVFIRLIWISLLLVKKHTIFFKDIRLNAVTFTQYRSKIGK
jgi:hypothetical protein